MNRTSSRSLVGLVALLLVAACGSEEKVCAADQRLCSNACVSPQSDARNCGACGNACGAGEGCSAGACVDCTKTPGACTTDVLAACFNLNEVRQLAVDLTPSGPPIATDAGPSTFARLGTTMFVANDLTGSLSQFTLTPPLTAGAPITVGTSTSPYQDLPVVAAHGGFLWASNAATNRLVVVDPASGKAVDELTLPTGPFGSNPQGIDFVGSKAYLALNGIDAVEVLDVSKVPGVVRTKTIDLAPLVPSGVSAMPSRVLAVGSKVYVSLWGFDPVTFSPPAGSHGRLAVVDTTTDTASSTVDLGSGCLNPGGMALWGTTLWVACGFHAYNSPQVTGGALIPVLLSGTTPVITTPIVLPANAAGSVALCDGRGYAGATESGTMLPFDPVTHSLLSPVLVCPASSPEKASYVSDVACAR